MPHTEYLTKEPVYHYLTEGLIPHRGSLRPRTSQKDQAFVLLPHLLSCLLCSVGPVGSLKNRALTTTGFKGDFRSNTGSLSCGQRPLKSFRGAAP